MRVSNRIFAEVFRGRDAVGIENCFEKLKELNLKIPMSVQKKILKEKLHNLKGSFTKRWKKCHRNWAKFEISNQLWLEQEFSYDFEDKNQQILKDLKHSGRPRKTFKDSSKSSKRFKVSELSSSAGNDVELGLESARLSAKRTGNKSLERILNAVSKNQQLVHSRLFEKSAGLTKLSPLESLGFILNLNLTKDQYLKVRLESKLHGADIYSTYDQILQAKQSTRPPGIIIEENVAYVSYQNIINHTSKGIVELEDISICNVLLNRENGKFIIIYNSGFDTSTGYSKHNQKFESMNKVDDSLILTVLIPLQLLDKTGNILWMNPLPHSTRFVRPVKMEFGKETKTKVLEMKADIDTQLQDIEPVTIILSNGKAVEVEPQVHLTAFDGKVRAIITSKSNKSFSDNFLFKLILFLDTSSTQCCTVCGATPTMMNKLENILNGKFATRPNTLCYGIVITHAWIRVFEFVINLSIKLPFKVWRRLGEIMKVKIVKREEIIKKRMYEAFGLRINEPRDKGAGNSNSGNTSRKAFNDPEKF